MLLRLRSLLDERLFRIILYVQRVGFRQFFFFGFSSLQLFLVVTLSLVVSAINEKKKDLFVLISFVPSQI